MKKKKIHTFHSISEFHEMAGLSTPKHPLVSMVDYGLVEYQTIEKEVRWIQDFYSIGFKKDIQGKFLYGQQEYDFDEGLIAFVAPKQVVHISIDKFSTKKPSGLLLFIHPDFIWNSHLATKIKQYAFFGYAVNEALFISEKEEAIISNILTNIQQEYHSNIDSFTQSIIISHIELLLNYCERFYQRQFFTRKKSSHELLEKLEKVIGETLKRNNLIENGLPSVHYVAESLNVSPNYLGSLLKTLTGLNTQQHIHNKLIDKAKELLSTTKLSVSEIAYELGFEHSQSFNRFFKKKTNITPLKFRISFN